MIQVVDLSIQQQQQQHHQQMQQQQQLQQQTATSKPEHQATVATEKAPIQPKGRGRPRATASNTTSKENASNKKNRSSDANDTNKTAQNTTELQSPVSGNAHHQQNENIHDSKGKQPENRSTPAMKPNTKPTSVTTVKSVSQQNRLLKRKYHDQFMNTWNSIDDD